MTDVIVMNKNVPILQAELWTLHNN